MTHSRLPTFVILGAQKSGTTSLHAHLAKHSDIFMSSPLKEPGFFLGSSVCRRICRRNGRDYRNLREVLRAGMMRGYSGERHFGESSTYYTIGRRSRNLRVPTRMRRMQPSLKFIYLLRDPVERVISNYLHSRNRGYVSCSFEEFFSHKEGQVALRTSQYYWQLTQYTDCFPKERFQIVPFEHYVREPKKAIRAISRHLGLPATDVFDSPPELNVSRNRGDALGGNARISSALTSLLREVLGEDIDALYEWMGGHVPEWKTTNQLLFADRLL